MKICPVCKGHGQTRTTRWCYAGEDVYPEGADVEVCEECWGEGVVEDELEDAE